MAEETPIKMLEKDHRKVEELFDDYNSETDEDEKSDLTEKICKELEIHAEIEEQYIYPMIEKISEQGSEMMEQSRAEHQEMKKIIMHLKTGDEVTIDDEKMQELESVVKDHVQEEESNVFPFAQENLADELGMGLAAKMLATKEKLRLQK